MDGADRSQLDPLFVVIGKDGTMTGYAGGVAAKAFLLALERRIAAPRA